MEKFIRTVLRGLECSNAPRLPDQILETKTKFIEQFLTRQTDVREMDDIGETVLSMAEIKALASGNPKIMERVMAQNEIMKLEQLRLSWQNERRNSQRQLASRKEEFEQTNLLENNTHPKLVSELLGHSNVNLTLNQYSHIINPMNTVVADTLDKAVNR